MPRPITVGVDGTAESRAAAAWAAREAVRRELPLRVVHAWQHQPHDVVDTGDHGTQRRWALDALEETASGLTDRHTGLRVTAELLEGAPVESLVDAGDGAAALVLGSRGHGAVMGFLLGSVGQQVVAEAGTPVVLVRAGDRAGAEAGGREVVVGQQGGPEDSAAALEFAFETAAARGAGVLAVRAWSLPPVFAFSPASLKLLDDAGGLEPYERQSLAKALEPWRERFPEVPVTQHVEMGSAGEVLLSLAPRAQLTVVGRRARRSAVGSRIGSVAHAVMHHATSPVAVVPPA
ncbi:universal stress protein [Streptomyces minutiscleroticus]|uniref:Universal stress protein n=1 Tax=Streptomyces minutiscleroticus TaxID=68238 RepID=A0A918KW59_9ACTN|nr:universal stress protein [Streptomyces minutiscleroticus]GGX75990.1 universal stress protein [Streptomyces minutiscleroticus]